jgi:hypothetical protein
MRWLFVFLIAASPVVLNACAMRRHAAAKLPLRARADLTWAATYVDSVGAGLVSRTRPRTS